MIPGLDAADPLPFRSVSVRFHVKDGVDEIAVGGFGFVPAFQAQVALLQPFDVRLDSFRFHRVDGPVVAVVAFNDESKRVLVHAHRLAVMAHARVQLREQLGHVERFGIEGAPDAAEVVADVFAESNGVGAVVFVGIRCLDVAATDGDDGVGGPGLLDFAGGPEELEEPLLIIYVSITHSDWVRSRLVSLQGLHDFAVRQAVLLGLATDAAQGAQSQYGIPCMLVGPLG